MNRHDAGMHMGSSVSIKQWCVEQKRHGSGVPPPYPSAKESLVARFTRS
jgi:hypothetical protein